MNTTRRPCCERAGSQSFRDRACGVHTDGGTRRLETRCVAPDADRMNEHIILHPLIAKRPVIWNEAIVAKEHVSSVCPVHCESRGLAATRLSLYDNETAVQDSEGQVDSPPQAWAWNPNFPSTGKLWLSLSTNRSRGPRARSTSSARMSRPSMDHRTIWSRRLAY